MMRMFFILSVSFIMTASCNSFAGEREFLGEENAKEIVKEALLKPNYNISTANVTDTASFIHAVEPELMSIYDKKNILNEKPYEIYHFDTYWVGVGTLPKGYSSGAFAVVLDVSKRKIIYITHGK